MMLPLLLSLVVSATDDPPVKVWLNHDNYFQRGDKARVNVKLADDGYLVVLRADAEGRVRALFDMVQRMTTEGRFDYDGVTYVVASARAYYDSYYPHYTAVGFGYGWGSPYRYGLYSMCYDPFYSDPFLCYDPFFYAPYRNSFAV